MADHSIQGYQDILSIIDTILTNPTASFTEIREIIIKNTPGFTAVQVSTSIELAVRLWLISYIRNRMPVNQLQLETTIPWPDTLSLNSVLQQHYVRRTSHASAKYPEHLNVYNIGKMAGFRVKWTGSKTDHLSIEGSLVYIYYNVTVLRRMRSVSK